MTDHASTQQVIAPADLYVAPLSRHVKAGETIEVDEALAASLQAQGWDSPAPKAKPEPEK